MACKCGLALPTVRILLAEKLSTYTRTASLDNKLVSDCKQYCTASNSRTVDDVLCAFSENFPTATACPALLIK